MARAMSANLGEGAKFVILGRGPTATYDLIKAKVAILGEGGQVCNSRGGGQQQWGGPFAHGYQKKTLYLFVHPLSLPTIDMFREMLRFSPNGFEVEKMQP